MASTEREKMRSVANCGHCSCWLLIAVIAVAAALSAAPSLATPTPQQPQQQSEHQQQQPQTATITDNAPPPPQSAAPATPQDPAKAGAILSPRVDYSNEWRPVGRGDPLQNDPTYDYSPPALERVRYWAESSDSKENEKKETSSEQAAGASPQRKVNPEVLLLGVRGGASQPQQQQHPLHAKNAKGEVPLVQPKYTSIRRSYYAAAAAAAAASQHHLPTHLMPPPMHQPISMQHMKPQVSGEYRNGNMHHQISSMAVTSHPSTMSSMASPTHQQYQSHHSNNNQHMMMSSTRPYYTTSMSSSPSSSSTSSSWMHASPMHHHMASSLGNNHNKYDTHYQESMNYPSYSRPSTMSSASSSLSSYSPNSIHPSGNRHAGGMKISSPPRKPWLHELLQKEVVKPVVRPTMPATKYLMGTTKPLVGISTTHPPVAFVTPTPPPSTTYHHSSQHQPMSHQSQPLAYQIHQSPPSPYHSAPMGHHPSSMGHHSSSMGHYSSSMDHPSSFVGHHSQPLYPYATTTTTPTGYHHPPPPSSSPSPVLVTTTPVPYPIFPTTTSATTLTPPTIRTTTTTTPSPYHSPTTTTSSRLLIPETSNLAHRPTVTPMKLTTDSLFKHYNQPEKPLRGPMYLIIEGHSKVKTYGKNDLDPHQPKIVPVISKREPVVRIADPNEKRGTVESFQVKHLHTKTTDPLTTTTTEKPTVPMSGVKGGQLKVTELRTPVETGAKTGVNAKETKATTKSTTTKTPTTTKTTTIRTSVTTKTPTTTTKPPTTTTKPPATTPKTPTTTKRTPTTTTRTPTTTSKPSTTTTRTPSSTLTTPKTPSSTPTKSSPGLLSPSPKVEQPPTGMQGLFSFLDESFGNLFKEADMLTTNPPHPYNTGSTVLQPVVKTAPTSAPPQLQPRIGSHADSIISSLDDVEYDDEGGATTEYVPRDVRQVFDYDQLPESMRKDWMEEAYNDDEEGEEGEEEMTDDADNQYDDEADDGGQHSLIKRIDHLMSGEDEFDGDEFEDLSLADGMDSLGLGDGDDEEDVLAQVAEFRSASGSNKTPPSESPRTTKLFMVTSPKKLA